MHILLCEDGSVCAGLVFLFQPAVLLVILEHSSYPRSSALNDSCTAEPRSLLSSHQWN